MTIYVSKVWGFDNPCGPLVFGMEGWRDRALDTLKLGDRVILVGTLGPETEEADRNRVLGMMEPSEVRASTSVFPPMHENDRRLYKEDGSFRWPYALINLNAWEFEPGLFLKDVAPREGNTFGSQAAVGLVPLTDEEAAKVLAYPHRQIPLLGTVTTEAKLVRRYRQLAIKQRGAPIPTEGVRRGIMHMRNAQAAVYWFQLIGDKKIQGHKIGWAFDWDQRLRQFNLVSMPDLTGLRYRVHRTQPFDTARQAYHVEQAVLAAFDAKRHRHNREVLRGVRTEEIEKVWDFHVQETMLRRHSFAVSSKPK